jgi:hypothetical protein
MRQTPRFSSAGFVKATVLGVDYETQDISEKGVKLRVAPDHPFRVGGEYIVYLFIAEAKDSPAQSAWSVMGECRWVKNGEAGFAFTSNSFIEREIGKILQRTPFDKVSEPDPNAR